MIQRWFQRLDEREKVIALAGGAAITALLLVLLVWRPLSADNARLQRQIQDKQALLGWMATAAAEVKALARSTPSPQHAAPVQLAVTRILGSEKIALERLQNQGDQQVLVSLREAPFSALLRSIDRLDQEQIALARATLRPGSTSGLVEGNLVFRR